MVTFAYPLPFGAAVRDGQTTRFRLWAPDLDTVGLEIEDNVPIPMHKQPDGWFEATASARPGTRYRYRLPGGLAVPDPASRLQAGDVHDPSVVVDPAAYDWRCGDWRGRKWHEAVIYELHAGAMGGFSGIRARLPALKGLGITAIELMPIADFPGQRNWGYDGVLPYAPDTAYGTPEELKALIDTAHELELMVMLDVVYNHFGPDGNYLHSYAEPFFRNDIATPWGAAIDFRQPEVREFFVHNALYWLMEYRFDGLRFDAVHAIPEPAFLDELAARIRQGVEPGRDVHLVLEHEGNKASLLGTDQFDAQWTDDVHHCLHVMLTGEQEGYYRAFHDSARLLARCMAEGFAYQGEIPPGSTTPRGEPSAALPTTRFVISLQNHDQIGNRAFGERLSALAPQEALTAATALVLLAPFIPMLFMGEEWDTTAPFLFFTDHAADLGAQVRAGRRREFARFAAFADPARRDAIPDPNAPATFAASVPDPAEREQEPHAASLRRHQELLAIRHRFIVPALAGTQSAGAEVLAEKAVIARWRLGTGALLTIAMNLGEAPVPIGPLAGTMLYGTADRLALVVDEGALPPFATVVYLTGPDRD